MANGKACQEMANAILKIPVTKRSFNYSQIQKHTQKVVGSDQSRARALANLIQKGLVSVVEGQFDLEAGMRSGSIPEPSVRFKLTEGASEAEIYIKGRGSWKKKDQSTAQPTAQPTATIQLVKPQTKGDYLTTLKALYEKGKIERDTYRELVDKKVAEISELA